MTAADLRSTAARVRETAADLMARGKAVAALDARRYARQLVKLAAEVEQHDRDCRCEICRDTAQERELDSRLGLEREARR